MKICVSMWSLYHSFTKGEVGIVDFIHWAANTEAEGVELLDFFWKSPEAELPQVLKALEETGLPVGAYAVGNNFAVEDEVERARQVKIVTDGVDMAEKLGTNVVRVFSGDLSPEVTVEKARGWIIDGLKEAVEYSEKKGVVLALENHGLLAGKSTQIKEFIEEINSPFLRSTFDTGNFLLVDEDPSEAATRLAPLVAHVHFKDFRPHQEGEGQPYVSLAGKKFTGMVAGEGEVQLTQILQTLKKAGYSGWLSIEFEGLGDDREGTIKSINNLKQSLQEI